MSVSKSIVTVIFIVDTSGSMCGQKIESVNAAVAECLGVLIKYQTGNENLMTGFLTFDEKAGDLVWERDGGAAVFKVKPKSNGFYSMTSFSCLYEGLYAVLRECQTDRLCLFLITDGRPTDSGEYADALEKVKSLEVFRRADRYVVLSGNDTGGIGNDVLEFVGFQADKIIHLSDLSGCMAKVQMLTADDGGNKARYESIFGD